MRLSTLAFTAVLLVAGTAAAADPAKVGKTDKGEALVTAQGMTLYVFDNDPKGQSVCYDKCAANWPPLPATDTGKATGKYSVIERKGGGKQWAYDGKPLYTWVKDTKPGDATGDGVGGVWHLAKP